MHKDFQILNLKKEIPKEIRVDEMIILKFILRKQAVTM
jgi:hypothetical protein